MTMCIATEPYSHIIKPLKCLEKKPLQRNEKLNIGISNEEILENERTWLNFKCKKKTFEVCSCVNLLNIYNLRIVKVSRGQLEYDSVRLQSVFHLVVLSVSLWYIHKVSRRFFIFFFFLSLLESTSLANEKSWYGVGKM